MSRNEDNPNGVSVYRPSSRSLSSKRQSRFSFPATTSRSRSSSRGNSTNRASIVDMYKQTAASHSASTLRREPSVTVFSGALGSLKIRRWDALKRTTTTWDSLRRDPELWFPGGDCFVHFYEQGQSRRGPSLRVSLADIEASNCRPLLERYLAHPVPDSPPSSPTSSSSSDGGFYGNPNLAGKHELFIAAPSHLRREEAFQYHLTTRNFFAWMFEKPLVGARLGVAAASLYERMNEYRPDFEENEDDILAYLDGQGYTDFRECPDHALAVLHFAEKFQHRDLWIDAFVHCVGMNNTLVNSSELETISRTTKALITRSRLEMDLRIDHANDSLGTFLEEELSGKYMGLPNEALAHLERFRSFLNSFYVQQYGYWPPTPINKRSAMLSRSVLRSMYFDFRSLYDYLVDSMSTCNFHITTTDGGICTLQNVTAFDRRYKLTSLPHPLPLVPDASVPAMKSRPSTFARLFNGKKVRASRKMAHMCALAAATNCEDSTVMESALVREYFRFEREWVVKEDEKISSPEARKVRWILVYAMLQTLISVTRAPVEVRDTEGVSYPLCCQTAGTPPWKTESMGASATSLQTRASIPSTTASTSTIDIRPDPDCITPAIVNATRRTIFTLSTTSTTALPMVPIQPVSPLTVSSAYTTQPSTPTSVPPTSKSRSRRSSISSIATTISKRRNLRKSRSAGNLSLPTPPIPTEPVPEIPQLDIHAPQPRRASAQIFVGNCDNSRSNLNFSLPSPTLTAPHPPLESKSPSPSSSAHSSSPSGDWSVRGSDDSFDMDHHSLYSDTASERKRNKSLSPPPLQITKTAARPPPPPPLKLKRNPTQEELPSRRPISSYTITSLDLPSPGLSQKTFSASLLACEPTSYAPVPLTASNALNSHPMGGGRGRAGGPSTTRARSPAPSVTTTIREKGKKLRSKLSIDSLRGREGRNPEVGEYLRGISRMSTRDVVMGGDFEY